MPETDPRAHATYGETPGSGPLRRLLVAAGLVLVALILLAVAIYAVAFLILAPMMQ